MNDTADPTADYDDSDWTGKIQLNWNINENTLAYVGASKGLKGGNWSAPSFSDSIRTNGIDRLPHGAEKLYSYEAGIKTSLLDRNLRINAAVFYYDYQDYQAFSILNFIQNMTNNDATVFGGELEAFYTPTENLDLSLGIASIHSDVKDIITPTGISLDTELPQAPELSINGVIRYNFDVQSLAGTISPQLDFVYNSSQWLDVTNAEIAREDSYCIVNARLTYLNSANDYTVAAWVKNLTDTDYRLYVVDGSGTPSPFADEGYAAPRTYGVTFSWNF